MSARAVYPSGRTARDRFVLERRGIRPVLDPWRAGGVVVDPEPDGRGGVVDVATIFLTGRECPWRCVMCDLWRHTIETDTPAGAIPRQIADALATLDVAAAAADHPGLAGTGPVGSGPRHVKLYNAGSFFDARAVPPDDDAAIARAVARFDRVIVESHPALIGERTWRLRDRVASLEVAMGLETGHPDALERLNKGLTLAGFARAASALAAHRVDLRVFLLVHPPFVPRTERMAWLERSIDAAVEHGATAIALIPTRGGNGAMEALAAADAFDAPTLADLEEAAAVGLRRAQGRARILADLWDLEACATCAVCLEARRARLLRLNLAQGVPEAMTCASCDATISA